MRVTVGVHGEDIDSALETYDLMSRHVFTHASPTMFNAGTVVPQLSSCFLVGPQNVSVKGIMDTDGHCDNLKDCRWHRTPHPRYEGER